MLKLFKELNMLEQLDQLIRQKATGTPEQLAKRLRICERDLYRIIAELREKDIKIKYCKRRCCYYYEVETFLKFYACVIENGKERKIIGGENNFENNFYTAEFRQCGLSTL
jgi:hypothetical protein